MAMNKEERMFVRREGSDTWHFHAACSNHPYNKTRRNGRPLSRTITNGPRNGRPGMGELCDECQAKARQDRRG